MWLFCRLLELLLLLLLDIIACSLLFERSMNHVVPSWATNVWVCCTHGTTAYSGGSSSTTYHLPPPRDGGASSITGSGKRTPLARSNSCSGNALTSVICSSCRLDTRRVPIIPTPPLDATRATSQPFFAAALRWLLPTCSLPLRDACFGSWVAAALGPTLFVCWS